MPLPSVYNFLGHNDNVHYGKEVHTMRFFLLKQKAIYPILGMVGAACAFGAVNAMKNLFGNPNVVVSRSSMGAWNTQELNQWGLDRSKFKYVTGMHYDETPASGAAAPAPLQEAEN